MDKVLRKTAHRSIKAVRLQKGTVTNDPKVVLEEVLSIFQRQHNTEDEMLSAYTEELISHLPKLYNRTQRRDMHHIPFTIRELDEVLYKVQPGKALVVHGLTAEPYRRLRLNLKSGISPSGKQTYHPIGQTWYTRCTRKTIGRTKTTEGP